MADFDLEQSENGTTTKLNQTKVDSFIKTIDSLNYTMVNTSSCPLSFAAQTPSTLSNSYFSINNDKYFVINGAYTMLPIKNNACLQHLSDRLLDPLGPFLKMPPVVPSWVYDLPEEEKEEKIAQVEQYGSPNVLNNFEPHVTVGYDVFRRRLLDSCATGECLDVQGQCQPIVSCFADPCTETPGVKCGDGEVCTPNLCGGCNFQCEALLQSSNQGQSQLRVDTMDQWNDAFQSISGQCNGEVMGVAVGRTGVGGTVLSDSRMGYWELFDDDDVQMVAGEMKDIYARVEE